ncbi:O-antigen ligase family protein [Parabacteroides bouchesdurhonensis]|uniref:O-antigen ligase family protein n=1 Tax=Parabacteroides bouchesdurhonensis TaxID=1936995 RepID=UPI000E4DBD3B|nr:O-antigen ligase family protein [Parabacteroides bouchesdurhonensis]RHJ94930.1 O-antigen ligase domain-containing protein [Bacteroides sp. AM07-16]
MIRLFVFLVLFITIPRIDSAYFVLPDFIYYGCFLGIVVSFILWGKGLKVCGLFLPFFLAIPISLLVNNVPSVFRAPLRAIAFLVIVAAVGPFIYNNLLIRFRKELFAYSLMMIRWVVLASFVGYLLRINIDVNVKGYRGFTYQPMLLGPMAGIAVLNYLYWIYTSTDKRAYLLNGIKLLVSFLVLILASSRSAIAACMLGIVFFIFTIYKGNLFRIMKVATIGLVLAVSTVSLWWPYTEKIREKMEYGNTKGSSTASRDALWTDRVNEFYHYPAFGVGFASYNLDLIEDMKFNKNSGVIEPGSSWLFLLSSMGLMGFFSCLIPLLYMLYRAFNRKKENIRNVFLGSILVLFMVHMFFEGYVVASGAYLCYFLWLFLSECYLCLINSNRLNYGVNTETGSLSL